MAKNKAKFGYDAPSVDARPMPQKIAAFLEGPTMASTVIAMGPFSFLLFKETDVANNLIFIILYLFYLWYRKRDIGLELRYPMQFKGLKHHKECAKAEGMMYLGNNKMKDETDDRQVWIDNSDARTHILFLGTTGAGKTEGLKLISANALTWGSGFVYVDGKGDTDVWASFYALARRFGRDDDLLLLNYMTGNADGGGNSNTMNPFASGSASYLTNLLVGLMDEAGGDNAMWKGRAISLMTAIMPALTWQRENEGLLLDVDAIRQTLTLDKVVSLSRNKNLPKKIAKGVYGYLDTLPGYVDAAFDDNGKEKPQGPDDPPHDLSTCYQQHGFLSMQFTRSLGSLADEYGYIFKQNLADIDINDVVLNNRMMFVTIPILEKSGDEAANLGKIVASSIKGMMGAALGADVEGSWQDIIENKITKRNSPFVTIFDEVGYYTSQGMAAMAAQARSLGFSLVFAGQDLAAMERRVKEEAKSITANCNLKIFGKLEDPTVTKDFFEKNADIKMDVLGQSGMETKAGFFGGTSFSQKEGLSVSSTNVVKYNDLRKQKQGHVHMIFESKVLEVQMAYIEPPKVKAIRIQNFLKVAPGVSADFKENLSFAEVLLSKYADDKWTAEKDEAVRNIKIDDLIVSIKDAYVKAQKDGKTSVESGTYAVSSLFGAEIASGADGSLDDFAKFFGDDVASSTPEVEKEEDNSDYDPFAFPKTFSQQQGQNDLMQDMEMDDFQKMLESYKSDSFDNTPPFANLAEDETNTDPKPASVSSPELSVAEPSKPTAPAEEILKPTINLTNDLPWEEKGSDISDDVINKALDEIWGRDEINAPIVRPEAKKEMSGDFLQAMKKYLSSENMDRKSVVNAVLRATADLIADNIPASNHAEALNGMAEEISAEEIKEEVAEQDIPAVDSSSEVEATPVEDVVIADAVAEKNEEVSEVEVEEVAEEKVESVVAQDDIAINELGSEDDSLDDEDHDFSDFFA